MPKKKAKSSKKKSSKGRKEPEQESEAEEPRLLLPEPGTFVLEGTAGEEQQGTAGSGSAGRWRCAVTLDRVAYGGLCGTIIDHWSEPRGERTETHTCTVRALPGRGIAFTNTETGEVFTAALVPQDGRELRLGALSVTPSTFPIAAPPGEHHVLRRVTEPRELMAEEDNRKAFLKRPAEQGRLSIGAARRRAEAKARRQLLRQCVPGEVLPAAPPRGQKQEPSAAAEAALSPPDDAATDAGAAADPAVSRRRQGEGWQGGGQLDESGPLDVAEAAEGTEPEGNVTEEDTGEEDDDEGETAAKPTPRETTAAAKRRAARHLEAGDFVQALTALHSISGRVALADREYPVLLAHAEDGVLASRGSPPAERTEHSRIYGPEEPPMPPESRQLQHFLADLGLGEREHDRLPTPLLAGLRFRTDPPLLLQAGCCGACVASCTSGRRRRRRCATCAT